jgi:hypothetical protein
MRASGVAKEDAERMTGKRIVESIFQKYKTKGAT